MYHLHLRRRKRQQCRIHWMPLLMRTKRYTRSMRKDDSKFFNYLRLSKDTFDELLQCLDKRLHLEDNNVHHTSLNADVVRFRLLLSSSVLSQSIGLSSTRDKSCPMSTKSSFYMLMANKSLEQRGITGGWQPCE